jgi:hypothetical protein
MQFWLHPLKGGVSEVQVGVAPGVEVNELALRRPQCLPDAAGRWAAGEPGPCSQQFHGTLGGVHGPLLALSLADG